MPSKVSVPEFETPAESESANLGAHPGEAGPTHLFPTLAHFIWEGHRLRHLAHPGCGGARGRSRYVDRQDMCV